MKTTVDYLKERLPGDLTIISVEEAQNKHRVVFEYKGTKTWADIPKTCSSDEIDKAIKKAMFTIYLYRCEYDNAKRMATRINAE